MTTLRIRHLGKTGKNKQSFHVELENGQSVGPFKITSPFAFAVKGAPQSNLMEQLRWYLEEFLEYPFPPRTDSADNVIAALDGWGKEAFNALFNNREAGVAIAQARGNNYKDLNLQIISDDPGVLQWPWEALRDPQAFHVAVESRIERRLNSVPRPTPISDKLPRDEMNVLLITARPYEGDVYYRSVSRKLVELVGKSPLPVRIHLLRPPTLESLDLHLRQHPHFYHVLHFDVHGAYGGKNGEAPVHPGTASGANDRHKFQDLRGVLVLEDGDGNPADVETMDLAALVRDHQVPFVALNACQSAMLHPDAADPFAATATALLKAGARGVVAMAYSLYVTAAQVFLPAFYAELFDTRDVSLAARAGRRALFRDKGRVCAAGACPLHDFIVPVVYRQDD